MDLRCSFPVRDTLIIPSSLIDFFIIFVGFHLQGIYYYYYQLLKNRVEDVAAARGKKGLGDGTVGMFSWLVIAAVAG